MEFPNTESLGGTATAWAMHLRSLMHRLQPTDMFHCNTIQMRNDIVRHDVSFSEVRRVWLESKRHGDRGDGGVRI